MKLHLKNCVQLTGGHPADNHRSQCMGEDTETARFIWPKKERENRKACCHLPLMGRLQREQSQILLRHLPGRYKGQCLQFPVQRTLIEYKKIKCPESDTALEQGREAVELQSWTFSKFSWSRP